MARIIKTEKQSSHYTFSLEKKTSKFKATDYDEPYFSDHLFVNIDTLNQMSYQIFRYIPSNEWLNDTTANLSTYSGKVQLLSADKNVLASMDLEDGIEIDNNSKENVEFTVTNRAILCTGSVYPEYGYYYTVSYDFYCSGGGNAYPDPTPSNPSDGDLGGGNGSSGGNDDEGGRGSSSDSPDTRGDRPECTGGKINSPIFPFACVCPSNTTEDVNGVCLENPTPCETALLSRDVYNTEDGQQEQGTEPIPSELSGGWELNNTLDLYSLNLSNSDIGFNSAVYQKLVNGVYQYLYVTEGTDPISFTDWYNNFEQISGNSAQYAISVQNAVLLDGLVGNGQLFFAGHSLGGGLASVNSLATGRTAFTYNATGISNSTRNLYDNGGNPQINATVVEGEILDTIQKEFDIQAEDSDTINYIEEESSFWQDFFNDRSPALNTYKSIRLHMIDTVIDILDCL